MAPWVPLPSYPAVELAYNQSPEIWDKNDLLQNELLQTNLRPTRLWARVCPQLAHSLHGGTSPADLQAAESYC